MYIYEKGFNMIELGISQAQTQFTKLLNKTVIIIDKKAHKKKAVIMPYDEYYKLTQQLRTKEKSAEGVFDKFIGILDKDFEINDSRYNKVI